MTKIKSIKGWHIFSNIRGDLFGGLTAGIVALPLALAFGVQSGMGALAGLIGAIFIGFFAALFGGTPTQISGPTAPMTAVSMVIIAGIIQANNGDFESAVPSILFVFFMAGLFQILFGFLKIGSLIKFIPYPVVSGFMTGIGVIIIITQLLPLFGYSAVRDQDNLDRFKPQAEEVLLDKILREEADEGLLVLEDFRETVRRAELITEEQILLEAKTLVSADASGVIGALKYLWRAMQNIDWFEFITAIVTILIIFGFKRITKKIPSTLVALLIITVIVFLTGFQISKIGDIPSGFPPLRLEMFADFSFSQVSPYIITAISLALLGAIDSLLTSVVADNMTKTMHDSNKELVGQGIGNSIAAVFGGIPGAGATIRTVVNIDAGGKTKLSGMIAALLLLMILILIGPLAAQIPKAVLCGILITVGIGVMDYKGLRALPSMPKSDAVVLILVLVLTVFWDLIFAVAVGLVLASLMFMKHMASISAENTKVISLKDRPNSKSSDFIPSELQEEILVKDLHGPLFFGYTRDFQQLVHQIPATASTVIIKMGQVPYMDQSGVNAMEDVIMNLSKRGLTVLFTTIKKQPLYMMEKIDIIPDLVPRDYVFDSMKSAMEWCKVNVEDRY